MAADQRRVADLLVRCLEHEGVTCVFGIPGEENIHFTDALARSSIRYVLVRHEQVSDTSLVRSHRGRLTGQRSQPGSLPSVNSSKRRPTSANGSAVSSARRARRTHEVFGKEGLSFLPPEEHENLQRALSRPRTSAFCASRN